jgi:hypothetical protein
MDATQALEILKQYRGWKLTPSANEIPHPEQLGRAIDAAGNALQGTYNGDILKWFNDWRRDDVAARPHGEKVSAAIDAAITMWGG